VAGISVEEVREAALPPGTILLGGRAGLHRGVTGTATLRARTPAFPTLHGGELALVPLPLLRQIEPRPRLDRLVSQLVDAGVAGIVILDAAPSDQPLLEQAAAAAEQYGLPVLSTPPRHTAEMVDVALHRHLAGRREALLRRSQELQQEFTALAFAGRGLPAIVERLAAITGLPAAWEDRSLELRGWATPPVANGAIDLPADLPTLLRGARLPLLRWAKSVRAEATPEVTVLPIRADSPHNSAAAVRLAVPFVAGGQVAGYLSLLIRSGAADGEARLALAGAGLAASIEALRARAVTEAQGNATASLVRDWLAGRFDHPGELAARASQLGHTPTPPYGVVILETELPLPGDTLQRLAQTLAGSADAGLPLTASLDERRTVLLIPAVSPAAVEGAAGPAHALLAALAAGEDGATPGAAPSSPAGAPRGTPAPPPAPGPSIHGGIGRPARRLEDVPQTYREAQQALAIARRLGGRHRVAYFGALGVYRLLAAVAPTEELSSFYADTLGPLVAHDQKSGGELLRTLDAYIACGGSPLDTAQRLHAHRNTVLYRLDRIAELLGVDVRHPEQRLLFHLALRAGEVLGELQPGALSQADGGPGPGPGAAAAVAAPGAPGAPAPAAPGGPAAPPPGAGRPAGRSLALAHRRTRRERGLTGS
jgi:purine catabolism regulator